MGEDEEKSEVENTMIKTKYPGWSAMPFIIGNETCEKLGTIGLVANFIIYLTTVFNMNQVGAATLVNVWSGTCNLATLIGAFLSDTYLGRYATIGFASISSLMGMLLVTITAALHKLHPPRCANPLTEHCVPANSPQLAVLLSGFALLAVGAGGIRPCNLAFGADQFDPTTENGKKGINSFFNWYYFTFTFAMMVSLTVIVYIQVNISWALGFGIPTVVFFFSCIIFFSGTKIYVRVRPEGSAFTGLAQAIVASVKKRKLRHVENPDKELFNPTIENSINSKLQYTDQFRFLNKAAIRTSEDLMKPDGSPCDPWRLCSIQKVEEVKCIIRILPIWFSCIIFYIAIAQQNTFTILQATKLDRHITPHFEIPAGSFNVFTMITLTIFLPLYDRMIVPLLRRLTGIDSGITLLQRIGFGFIIEVIAMILAGIVESKRRSLALSNGTLISPLSAGWLVPQFVLTGIAESFSIVGQFEFYYKQFPENMRSLAGSFFFLGMAGANYISGFLVTVVHNTTGQGGQANWLAENLNYGRLDLYYYMIAAFGAINILCFLVSARWYRYKGVDVRIDAEEMSPTESRKVPV